MVCPVFFKGLPPNGPFLFRFINTNVFFLLKNETFCSEKRLFCSDNEKSNGFNKFYVNYDLRRIRKNQNLYFKDCGRYASLSIPDFNSSNSCNFFLDHKLEKNDEHQTSEAFDSVKEKLHDFSFEELLGTVRLLLGSIQGSLTESQRHFVEILNKELERRENNLTADEILKSLKILSPAEIRIKFNFYWLAFRKLTKKLNQLTLEQVVYYLPIYNRHRSCVLKELKYNIFDEINKFVPQLNEQELGIVSFNLCHPIFPISHTELLNSILKRTIEKLDSITSDDILCVAHLMHKKAFVCHSSLLLELQEKLISYISNYSTMVLPFIASSGERLLVLNFTLFDKILRIMKNNFDDFNANSILRIVRLFVLFNRKDDEFLQMAIKKFIEYANEGCSFCQVKFVRYLICLGIYEKKLIEKVMSDEYQEYIVKYNTRSSGMDFLYVHGSLQVENIMSDLSVSDKVLKQLNKCFFMVPSGTDSIENSSFFPRKFTNNFENIYGPEFFAWKIPIKHHQGTYILRFDKNLKPQPVPEEYKIKRGRIVMPLNDDHFWVALVGIKRNPTGTKINGMNYDLQTKCRQLRAIGYTPVEIYFGDWMEHVSRGTDKEYVENQIIATLQKELKNC